MQHKPGPANQMLQELAPLLAEEGIDVNNIDVPTGRHCQEGNEPRRRTQQHDPVGPPLARPESMP